MKNLSFLAGICLVLSLFAVPTPAACPSADLTGDCYVDLKDFAVLAEDWLTGDHNMATLPATVAFAMGDAFGELPAAMPVHDVSLESFDMGKFEITNGQYCQFLKSALAQNLITVTSGVVYQAGSGTTYPYCNTSTANAYSQISYSGGTFSVRSKGSRGDMSNDPMIMVSWYGAAAYCNWRSQEEGNELCYDASWNCDFSKKGYRLPTEAEWEYAARGGLVGKRFPLGDTITHGQANYFSSSSYAYDISSTRGFNPTWNNGIYPYTAPVGSFAANAYDLYDMSGNVWEWCNDWYDAAYYTADPAPVDADPTGPATGTYAVLRGGSWSYGPDGAQVAYRYGATRASLFYYYGFRLVLDMN